MKTTKQMLEASLNACLFETENISSTMVEMIRACGLANKLCAELDELENPMNPASREAIIKIVERQSTEIEVLKARLSAPFAFYYEQFSFTHSKHYFSLNAGEMTHHDFETREGYRAWLVSIFTDLPCNAILVETPLYK